MSKCLTSIQIPSPRVLFGFNGWKHVLVFRSGWQLSSFALLAGFGLWVGGSVGQPVGLQRGELVLLGEMELSNILTAPCTPVFLLDC